MFKINVKSPSLEWNGRTGEWKRRLAQRIEKRGHTQYAHPVEQAHWRQSLLLLTAGVLYDFGVDEEDYLLRYVRQMVSRALQFAECAA